MLKAKINLKCDGYQPDCEKVFPNNGIPIRITAVKLRKLAKKAGWWNRKSADLCKSCKEAGC